MLNQEKGMRFRNCSRISQIIPIPIKRPAAQLIELSVVATTSLYSRSKVTILKRVLATAYTSYSRYSGQEAVKE